VKKEILQKQIQNLRNKRFAKAKFVKTIPEKSPTGSIKLPIKSSVPRIIPIKKINSKQLRIDATPIKKSSGCGCGRKKRT